MKILGISAHYHDSPAALVIDGVPVCAVQEERLSRRKGDAAFPLAAIEWCLEYAGPEPKALDAVVFYERPMLKFERILTCTLRAFPRFWRAFPKGDEELGGREGLDARNHLVATGGRRGCAISTGIPRNTAAPSPRGRPVRYRMRDATLWRGDGS